MRLTSTELVSVRGSCLEPEERLKGLEALLLNDNQILHGDYQGNDVIQLVAIYENGKFTSTEEL